MSVLNRPNTAAFLIFSLLAGILTMASSTFGLTWDESSYFKFFDSIRLWFLNNRSFDPATLAAFWDYSAYHNPHPPFMKIIGAIFSHFFKDILPYPAGYRLGNIVYVAGCLALCYRLLLTSFTRTAAAAAIVFVCFQPRVFGHLMIAATDSPVAVSWLALTLVGWRLSRTTAASKKTVLRLFLFILLACASATKITGFLVVLPLGAYFLTQQNFRELGWLAGAALFSLLFTVLVFPPDWFQPFTAVKDYLLYPFERSEVAISTFYLGKIYKFYLPWHYFLIMTVVTCPVILLILLFGLIYAGRLNHDGLLWALLFPAGFWLIIVHLPATPKHDGIRQFVSFYPFLGLLSWLGLSGFLARLKQWPRFAKRLSAQNVIMIFAPAILFMQTSYAHPFELSFYNCLAGGIEGAEKKGLETTYYLEAAHQGFMRRIDPYLHNGVTVAIQPSYPLLLEGYSRHGLLEGHFTAAAADAGIEPDYLLIFRRRSCIDDERYASFNPLQEVTYRGISLVKFGAITHLPRHSEGKQ